MALGSLVVRTFRFLNKSPFPGFCTKEMNIIARSISSTILRRGATMSNGNMMPSPPLYQVQSWRGIRVRVNNGNLEQALSYMGRQMVSSGIERLITRGARHHVKNSEKRVLARKRLENRIRKQDLSRKLTSILLKKVRGL